MSLLMIESLFSNHSLFEILEVLAVEESEKWGFDQDKENYLSYGKIAENTFNYWPREHCDKG